MHDIYSDLYNNCRIFRESIRFYKYVLKINPYLQVVILILFVALIVYSKCKKLKFKKGFALSIVVPYIAVIYSSLVLSRSVNADYQYCFELFWTVKMVASGRTEFLKEIIANIFMLFPVGLLLPVLLTKNKRKTIPIGIGISASVELLQLVTKTGMCELDDLIYNTLGLLIGYGVYCLIVLIKNSCKNREKNNV